MARKVNSADATWLDILLTNAKTVCCFICDMFKYFWDTH